MALSPGGADRDKLEPILDACVSVYRADLDEDGQIDFKGKAKVFTRTYGFLVAILPYTNVDWERLSNFLNLLTPKLPAPEEQDLSKGIPEAIDMDSLDRYADALNRRCPSGVRLVCVVQHSSALSKESNSP